MENLNRLIKAEMNNYYTRALLSEVVIKTRNIQKQKLYSDFEIWILNLKNSMHLCKYRKVIGEIESRQYEFKTLGELHWKYQYIELDAIFKILKKKIAKHKNDISIEESHHYHSCLFWFNQIYRILEIFILRLRPDLNKNIDYNNKNTINPIKCVIDIFIKFCFLLILFAKYNKQLPEILTYLSAIDRIIPYMKFTSKKSSFIYLQKIRMFKVKILAENCNYLNALNCLESNIKFCLNYMKLLCEDKFIIDVFDLTDEKNIKYLEKIKKKRLFKIYEYKGFIKQSEDEDNNINKFDFKINNKNDLLEINKQKLKNIEKLNDIKDYSPKKYKGEKKLKELKLKKSISRNNNSIYNKTLKESESRSTIATKTTEKIKNLKRMKSINKSINEIFLIDEREKRQLRLEKMKSLNIKLNNKKSVIEEVIKNIALNFYLRGAIFEHVGNIDSALDSYKAVEWFTIKFLSNKFPSFFKYITSLLDYAWSNYNIIYEIKYEKIKLKKKNEILKEIELIQKRKIREQERCNKEIFRVKSNKLFNNKRLKNFLIDLGNKIYKEEEQRNFNI